MTLVDIDRNSDDRVSPMPNTHDVLSAEARMARGTTSVNYQAASANNLAIPQVLTGIWQPITAGKAVVSILATGTSISQTNIALATSLTDVFVLGSVVPPYYLVDSINYSYTIFPLTYIGAEFPSSPKAWISLSASSKGQPQTINFFVIPGTNAVAIGDWIFTYYVFRQKGDQS